jgi:uncharacterized membrane protein SirB2
MSYLALKHFHVACVVLSGCGFVLRGLWMIADSPKLARPWVRVAPHIVDTALLASAIALSLLSQQYPLAQAWLTAKIVALAAYIGIGSIALRRGRNRRVRVLAWCAALLIFGYIVSVALARDPRGFIGWLGA